MHNKLTNRKILCNIKQMLISLSDSVNNITLYIIYLLDYTVQLFVLAEIWINNKLSTA